ncbi:amino acid ABC transporter permease [Paenibacillus pasadenensis]|uniref:Glutamate transport membrane-spanning protein n=1 Tax=Paenibacillus pasadenensis TaxID=217090 RepID=A0A2N5N2I4_9BACL|nr:MULTISPECIES: amino acid ABC transporter permease [Paenibacillus]PLT44544.1 Glutamate transport membrane-spanning protein [Paenibacillus pasadenensis]QGG55008.1 ABC transporter permease subunit [Paenibacillus sp. B01]
MDFAGAFSSDNLLFLLKGFGMTLIVAAVAIVLSFILGTALGLIRYSRIKGLGTLTMLVVETIRNLPLLLIIFFVKFALPEVGIQLSTFWAAVVALTLFEGAMISEIVRSGLQSVNKGLVEAARSSGLTQAQTLRHVVLPIGMRRMVPPLVSQFISLLKDTSLAVVISLPELMHSANIVYGHDVSYVFPVLLLAAVLYFAVNYSLSLLSKRLESNEGARRRTPGAGKGKPAAPAATAKAQA